MARGNMVAQNHLRGGDLKKGPEIQKDHTVGKLTGGACQLMKVGTGPGWHSTVCAISSVVIGQRGEIKVDLGSVTHILRSMEMRGRIFR